MTSSALNQRGILAMIAAMACFTVNDTCVKLASQVVPLGIVMMIRGGFAFMLALLVVSALGQLKQCRRLVSPIVMARALLEALVAGTFISAASVLPLAIVAAIMQSTPIIMSLLVVAVKLEQINRTRWIATLIGFGGVLLVVRPTTDGLSPAVILALISAVGVACRDLLTGYIDPAIPSSVITLTTTLGVGVVGCLLTGISLLTIPLSSSMGVIQERHMELLLGAAVAVTIGNFAIVQAFRGTDVSVVSPFRYTVMIWAVLGGYYVFGDFPDLITGLGMVLIMLAGWLTLYSQRHPLESPPVR